MRQVATELHDLNKQAREEVNYRMKNTNVTQKLYEMIST